MWGHQDALRAQAAMTKQQTGVDGQPGRGLAGDTQAPGPPESQQAGEPAPRVTPCSEGTALGTATPAAAARALLSGHAGSRLGLRQPASARSSRTGRRKSNEMFELPYQKCVN